MLNKTYPVGSIYISYSNSNPKDLFGGHGKIMELVEH